MYSFSTNVVLLASCVTLLACGTEQPVQPRTIIIVQSDTDDEVEDEEEQVDDTGLVEIEEEEEEEEVVEEEETEEVDVVREAEADFDSMFEPAADVYLGGSASAHEFFYEEEVSFPGGDRDDWIRFQTSPNTTTTRRVHFTLTCLDVDGDAETHLRATLYQDGASIGGTGARCGGETQTITLEQNTEYDLRIHFSGSVEAEYAHYEILIED